MAVMSEVSRELLQVQQQQQQGADVAGTQAQLARQLRAMGAVLGLLHRDPETVLRGGAAEDSGLEARVEGLIAERAEARKARNWARADEIRAELTDLSVVLEDTPAGTTWRVAATVS